MIGKFVTATVVVLLGYAAEGAAMALGIWSVIAAARALGFSI